MVFFYLSKIFPLLFFPYPLSLILFTIICIKMPAGSLRRWARLGLSCLLLLSFPPLANLLLLPLEKAYPSQALPQVPKADVIIVLAGMVRPEAPLDNNTFDQPEFTGSVDRILAAEKLLTLGKAPILVISGSSGLLAKGSFSEASLLKKWLRKRHPKLAAKILSEDRSRNTAQSAKIISSMAKKQGWNKILLVSSAYHLPRSVACFDKQKTNVIPVAVDFQSTRNHPWPESAFPSLSGLSLSTLALREYLGLLSYQLKGYI